ncbi:MAG: YbaY family lipoprotein [Halioglobus sp.]
MTRLARWTGALSFVLLAPLTGCGDGGAGGDATSAEPSPAKITGTVLYRERMMLPPGAELKVQLEDISRADALAEVLAVVTQTPEGGPPFTFAIDYDAGRIDERHRYALRATITLDGNLMFTTTEYTDPFQAGPIEMMVERVPQRVPQ